MAIVAANPFPSLTGYSANALVNVVIMLLIVIGGIGFLTWDDIYINKLNFKRYRMQSKIILMTTACLILFPVVFFFTCDLKNLSTGNRLLAAAFQSVTTRTAGFNTIDISKMSEPSKAEYPVREGKGLAAVPRISNPALQKAEME